MARAAAKHRLQSAAEAQELLQELDRMEREDAHASDDDDAGLDLPPTSSGRATGKMTFGGRKRAEEDEEEEGWGQQGGSGEDLDEEEEKEGGGGARTTRWGFCAIACVFHGPYGRYGSVDGLLLVSRNVRLGT
jgi:hypothetical protein